MTVRPPRLDPSAARGAMPAGRHTTLPRWRFVILAEIVNFSALRRHLGCARAHLLVEDLLARIEPVVAGARVTAVSRTLVEIAFEGAAPADLAQRLVELRVATADAFVLDGEPHEIEVAFGAASGAASVEDIHLIEEAEAALAEARGAPQAVTHDLTQSHRHVVAELAKELHRAVEQDELMMLYQPKVHVRQQAIESAEALVRWRHPERGLVLPGDFIPAAEEGQVIDRMTLWTIARVIADQRRLREAGHDLRIYVNISGQLLADADFVREACRLVVSSGARLGFEVTETSVIRDPASAIANLQSFADHGIHIAIDDYGAGLSSLAYLKQLPARELKIDKLFVTQLTSSNRDPLIVRSTIDLAHALEMEVVAEGVETPAAMALLTVMGCDIVQGFLISRPIAFDALVGFLDDYGASGPATDYRAAFPRLASAWKRS